MSGNDFLISNIGRGTDALEQARIQKLQDGAKKAAESGANGTSGISDAQKAEMEKAATQFEGLLLHQLFNTMWKTVPEGGVLGGGREEKLYRDMLNQSLADQIAEGQGVGLKDVILRELTRKYGG